MARFNDYIFVNEKVGPEARRQMEEKYIPGIKKNSKGWLDLIKRCSPNKTLWRGVDGIYTFLDKSVRKDREPFSIKQSTHKKLDELFEKYFGWRARSSGLFVTGQSGMAEIYGDSTHLIFPAGCKSYLWSRDIGDLFSDVGNRSADQINWASMEHTIRSTYNDKNICQALNQVTQTEIMLNCKKYYGINYKMIVEYMRYKDIPIDPANKEKTGTKFIEEFLLK